MCAEEAVGRGELSKNWEQVLLGTTPWLEMVFLKETKENFLNVCETIDEINVADIVLR